MAPSIVTALKLCRITRIMTPEVGRSKYKYFTGYWYGDVAVLHYWCPTPHRHTEVQQEYITLRG